MNGVIKKNFTNEYKNPYRHGVLIGNFVEDMIGEDLKKKLSNETIDKKNYVSETCNQFQWPQLKENHINNKGNDLTSKNNSNFDFNIDFNLKNIEDYSKLQGENEYQLKDKNSFLLEQIKSEKLLREFEKNQSGKIENNSIYNETQNMLKKFIQTDADGHLFTKKSGLVKNIFFGHGIDQRKFDHNEYASTYQ